MIGSAAHACCKEALVFQARAAKSRTAYAVNPIVSVKRTFAETAGFIWVYRLRTSK